MYATFDSYQTFTANRREGYSDIDMKILLKFPSRSRPDQLLDTFKKYITMASNPARIHALISLDIDDKTATQDLFTKIKAIHADTDIRVGQSKGKIGAVNRDMEHAGDYDILLLASDDMIPRVQGYDAIIRAHMKQYYPDTDGVLWYNDGYQGKKLNTLCILGNKYYQRFGYIYHPSYKSLYCDNEFMEVANRLNLQTYIDQVIIKHEHPAATGANRDELYVQNQVFVSKDYQNFMDRRAKQFSD